jgi:hypothetical protein
MTDRRYALSLLLLVLLVAGCGGAATPSATPTAPPGPVTTPEEAVARVIALEPRLTGIGPRDPDMIGQAAWYEVLPASGVGAFVVTVRVGWGDCPAGCIDEHSWTYAVLPDGTVNLQSEGGPEVPADAWPAPGGVGRTGISILATAGPTCPVVTPNDPKCQPQPVVGAVVVVRDAGGNDVARAATDASGAVFIEVPAGGYAVEAQPVEGLMGTPAPVDVTVVDGAGALVALAYDTGIR